MSPWTAKHGAVVVVTVVADVVAQAATRQGVSGRVFPFCRERRSHTHRQFLRGCQPVDSVCRNTAQIASFDAGKKESQRR